MKEQADWCALQFLAEDNAKLEQPAMKAYCSLHNASRSQVFYWDMHMLN